MSSHNKNQRISRGFSSRKIFYLSVEGSKTEPQYFSLFNDRNSTIQVSFLKRGDASAPPNVLKKMREHLKKKRFRKKDEAWLVVDRDQWTGTQLKELHQWSQEKENYGLALSNPNFEFWLLLHFEDGKGASDPKTCTKQLKKHLPNYKKDIDTRKITDEGIKKAIKRAKDMKISFNDLLSSKGTTVYKLVENIMKTREEK